MLNKFGFENINKSKSATGLEIILLADGSYEINIVVLKKNKSTLVTEKQKAGIKSFEEAAKLIDLSSPIILILNGKGIIHKKVSVEENDTPTKSLNKVFPNANLNEFNIQETLVNSISQTYISIIRSSVLNEVIEKLKTNKLTNISGCSLGPFVVNNLLTLINKKSINNELLNISGFQLKIGEQEITEIENASSNIDSNPILIGDENVPPKLVIAFAGALSYFIGSTDGIINSDTINDLKEEFVQKRKFELMGWTLLIAVLLILTVNFFVFNNYWSKRNQMGEALTLNQSAVERYDMLKKEFTQKNEFLEKNGLLESSRTSFYADKLAESLPLSIHWTDVNIHPVKKKQASETSEGFFFENKMIRISGKCQRSTDLNGWMKEVKLKPLINSVTLLNYTQDNETDDGLFLIEIKLNN